MKQLKEYIIEKFKISSKNISKQSDPEDPSTWDVSDILAGTFGYSMTLPVFYEVVKRTPSQFTLVKLSKKVVSGHHNGSFEEIPDESKRAQDLKGNQIRARLSKNTSHYLKVDSAYVRLWDGKPVWGNDLD